MFHKIKNVYPKDNMIIEVDFDNKVKKEYDIKTILNKWIIFKKLEDEELFKKVKVDVGGYGVSWNENIDLSCEELWKNGKDVK